MRGEVREEVEGAVDEGGCVDGFARGVVEDELRGAAAHVVSNRTPSVRASFPIGEREDVDRPLVRVDARLRGIEALHCFHEVRCLELGSCEVSDGTGGAVVLAEGFEVGLPLVGGVLGLLGLEGLYEDEVGVVCGAAGLDVGLLVGREGQGV